MWREMVLLIPGSLCVRWAYSIPMLRSKSKSIVSQFVSSASSDLHFKVFQGCIMKGILTLFMKLLKLLGVYVLLFHLAILWICHFKAFWNFFPYPVHREENLHSSVGMFFPFLSVAFRLFDLRQTGFIEREEVWYFWDHNKKNY